MYMRITRLESGVAVMPRGTVVDSSSTAQNYVTPSSSEAECVNMAQGARTLLFTEAVADSLRPKLSSETIIELLQDNQAVIVMAEYPISGDEARTCTLSF